MPHARQQLTFCGANAHFQNGITKQAIWDLLESVRKQLLRARACWPEAVHFALWPYALRNAAYLHNNLPVLEDGTSRLELFSSIQVGSKLKHVHTFGCPVFALQNVLASGSQLPRWSPGPRLGLNLGPSLMHARNVYLVLNLVTGCISPQYHCHFDNCFETMCHGAPDVSGTICWQQLANLDCAKTVLSKVSVPNQHNVMYSETPFDEEPHTMSNPVFDPNTFDTTSDDYSVSEALQVSENSHTSLQNQSSHTTDEMMPVEPTVTAGTSQRGRVCTMSQRMAESVSQQDFYTNQGMHYMASQATSGNTDEDLFNDAHLQLQEQMRNPIAFHAEMMGDIMYLQQVLKQPDAKDFVQAVIKEVNGHVASNNWMLQKQSNVPEDVQIVPSVWSLRCKCNLTTNKVKSHKARLNLHGGKQVYGMNYFETYTPAVTWFAIRLMIIFGIIFCWAL
jgi:hypothetical protein